MGVTAEIKAEVEKWLLLWDALPTQADRKKALLSSQDEVTFKKKERTE